MIYSPNQRAKLSHEAAVAPGAVFTSEAQVAVRASGASSEGVLPSTGTSADVFEGFVIAGTAGAPFTEEYATKVEVLTVPTAGAIQLQFEPVSGQVGVFDITEDEAVASADMTVAGKVISGLDAGNDVRVTYRYSLTVTQSRALQGDATPGGYAGNHLGQIGVVSNGLIYTSNFDASKDWSAATAVKMAANGQVTDQSGTGNAIPCSIVDLPSVEVPFLGLRIHA